MTTTEPETSAPASAVHGTVVPGFEPVRDAFAAAVAAETAEPGAQLAVHLDGRPVVDLWAGEGLDGDSLLAVYSSTKGAAHTVAALLVQDGLLDLDREVAHYWPEFAAGGKERVTVRQLLAHQAGVIGLPRGLTARELADDRVTAELLAAQEPFWEPGTASGYHGLVIGALVGEVVRRITGRTLQEVWEERVRAPFGLDFHLGLPEELEPRYLDSRPAVLTSEQQAEAAANAPGAERLALIGVAFSTVTEPPVDLVAFVNTREVRALGQASAAGVASARGLARFYAAASGGLDGRPALLAPGTIAEFSRLQWPGEDLVVAAPGAFAVGFEYLPNRFEPLTEGAFGHSGAAGSLAFADPASGVAYGYTRRRHAYPGGAAPENQQLIAAVVEAARATR
jgi:CubicO group peptidase (beta-lactamase class C family)